ncbi:hypothetical protein LINGRAHAP2_LOCUS699 [Linum grandiflorum]
MEAIVWTSIGRLLRLILSICKAWNIISSPIALWLSPLLWTRLVAFFLAINMLLIVGQLLHAVLMTNSEVAAWHKLEHPKVTKLMGLRSMGFAEEQQDGRTVKVMVDVLVLLGGKY